MSTVQPTINGGNVSSRASVQLPNFNRRIQCRICLDEFHPEDVETTPCLPVPHHYCHHCLTVHLNITLRGTPGQGQQQPTWQTACPTCGQQLPTAFRLAFLPGNDHQNENPSCLCGICSLLRHEGIPLPQPDPDLWAAQQSISQHLNGDDDSSEHEFEWDGAGDEDDEDFGPDQDEDEDETAHDGDDNRQDLTAMWPQMNSMQPLAWVPPQPLEHLDEYEAEEDGDVDLMDVGSEDDF